MSPLSTRPIDQAASAEVGSVACIFSISFKKPPAMSLNSCGDVVRRNWDDQSFEVGNSFLSSL